MMPPPLQLKGGLIRKLASLERDNLVVHVFYNLNASELWLDKRCGI